MSLTCVLGTGQGKSQGPEQGRLSPATHCVQGGVTAPRAASEEGPGSAGAFCSPELAPAPVALRRGGGA